MKNSMTDFEIAVTVRANSQFEKSGGTLMTKSPLVLGINRTQDGSMTLMQGSNVICSIQKERFTRERHHWGKLGDVPL